MPDRTNDQTYRTLIASIEAVGFIVNIIESVTHLRTAASIEAGVSTPRHYFTVTATAVHFGRVHVVQGSSLPGILAELAEKVGKELTD